MILYTENLTKSTEKLLKLMNELSKFTGYKINIQKSVAFLYTNNKVAEREIKKSISLIIVPNRIHYLGINLIKAVKVCTLKTIKH